MAGPYYVRSSAAGAATGADWANAFTTLLAATAVAVAGENVYVAKDHTETGAAPLTITLNGSATAPVSVYVVDHTGSVPPVAADLFTGTAGGGTIITTGANAISINGVGYIYGLYVQSATGANATVLNLASTSGNSVICENCTFFTGGTTGGGVGATNTVTFLRWLNCVYKPSSTSATLDMRCPFEWTRGSVDATVKPTTLFRGNGGTTCVVEDVDLSGLSGSTIFPANASSVSASISLRYCRLPANFTTLAGAQTGLDYGQDITMFGCDVAGGSATRIERVNTMGALTTDKELARNATDGVTRHSHKIVTLTHTKFLTPFRSIPISVFNTVTGAQVTVTMFGLADPRDFSAIPKNDDIWFDLQALDPTNPPFGAITSGTRLKLTTGVSLTADSVSNWTGGTVAARANSNAYSVGDKIKLASNPGRVFVCTASSGNSAGSEPGGYATAVDGGSVTDGSCTFKAMWRWSLAVTTSGNVGAVGPLRIFPNVAKASSVGVYFDPALTISGVTLDKTFPVGAGEYINALVAGAAAGLNNFIGQS